VHIYWSGRLMETESCDGTELQRSVVIVVIDTNE